MRRRPVEPGEDAGERSREIRHAVGDDRQAEARKACGVAIGIEDEAGDGGGEPRDHPVEDGRSADRDQRLVAAAHAPREAAGEDEAESGGIGGCGWQHVRRSARFKH